ncbi:phage major tail protein [Ligilactobacillus hayakitensis DSM 18933 = JCM 14209]|uniref:Phage major tail protein n=1 Tax=Ligilactobacillus hayakitensis DSM 18933 = JCM 14209 TaxID=1423755 RepID=A0A0R1X032_9LACO|nr:phage tail protein [Ligilactobacillus hayakitensis]KRM20307.1 phage major tail protein [Ligilactobacillus hayakitensis DSM 18933 = JCM 14209]
MAGATTHGILYAAFGIVDDKGDIIKDAKKGVSELGVEVVDGDGEGATTANITGLEQNGTIKWANNKAKRITHGKQQPQVALTMLDIKKDLLNRLKGYVSDGKGGYVLTSGSKPNVALLICSEDMDGTRIYEGFANGELTQPAQNHGTDNNNITEADTALTYQALAPIKDTTFVDDKGVTQPYKVWADDEAGFDINAMFKEVFGGFDGVASLKIPGGTKTNSVAVDGGSELH